MELTTRQPPERAASLHPRTVDSPRSDSAWNSRCEEFIRLAKSSGCEHCAGHRLPVRQLQPATLFGSGQVEVLAGQLAADEISVAFVDHQLSPVQQRNLEKAWNVKVVDRTGLILEIFAARARTREGRLQVELASLNYQLGRLVRSWTHLERQRGGHGFLGGPGERQIELDRRMIRQRIQALEKELQHVRRMRATQRSGRQRKNIRTVALVGYTNAGKSTLFNRLCASSVHAADQLFATLDPTLRKVTLPGGMELMLSDTVGFVQDLPHELVDAFRATLEEVMEADLILHVRDMADEESVMQKQVVEATLQQLGLDGDNLPPMIELLNKCDLAPQLETRLCDGIHGSRIAISALHGQGVSHLMDLLQDWLQQDFRCYELRFPASDGRSLAYCHAKGEVLNQRLEGEDMLVQVRLAPRDAKKLESH